MQGLRVKPSYEQLMNVAVSDGLEQIKFLNRDATFLGNGYVLSQLDGDGMRIMEDQQKRHIKEVYMDSALRSLASDRSSDSVSNFSFKSAHTQNTAIERINAMLTESINSRKAEYFDLFGNDMEPQHELDSSSSDGQNYSRNHIHIEDHFNSMRDLQNEPILREMEAERRSQEINDNNTKMFQEELFKVHGEHDMQNRQTQQVVNDLLRQIQTQVPPPYDAFSDIRPKPLFPQDPQDPQDPVMQKHLRAAEMSQQPRKPNAASASSNNDPEPIHELKGNVGRPRNHGIPTETRTDPFYWEPKPTEFIRAQLSNRGWRTPRFQHLTAKGTIAKRLTREHYLKELFYLLDSIDY